MKIPLHMMAAPLLALFLPLPAMGSEFLGFNEAVDIAARTSPAVRAQQAARDAAKATEQAAGRLPDPRLVLGIDNLPVEGPNRFSLDADFMTMRRLGVMQDVPNRARRHAVAKTAAAATQRENALLNMEVQTRRSAAAQAWLAAHFAQDRVALVSHLADDYSVLEDATRGRLAAGSASAGDVLAIRQEVLALEDQRDALSASARSARVVLDSLTGDSSGKPLSEELPELTVDPAHLRDAVASHVAIAPFSAEAAVAEGELAEAEASKKGDWAWQLSYSKRGPRYEDMMSAEVSRDLPLWQSTRQGPAITAKERALNQVEARRDEAMRLHRVELETDLADLESAERQLTRLRTQAVPLAEQRVSLAQVQYRTGEAALSDVFVTRRDLLMQKLRELDLLEKSLGIKARLNYLSAEEQP